MKLVLILLDACRYDYISKDTTPFLYKLSKNNKYYPKIAPSYGFCERSEIFIGKTSYELDLFTSLGFNKDNSPYKNYFFFDYLDKIEKFCNSKFISKLIRRFIWEISKNKKFSYHPAKIPLNILKYFALTEDGKNSYIDSDPLSLFNLLKDKVFKNTNTSLTNRLNLTDDQRLDLVLQNINSKYIFYPVYISILDQIGHSHGPNSLNIKTNLKILDKKIESFYNKIIAKNNKTSFIFCGDHGMATVKNTINIIELINEFKIYNSMHNEDLIYFIDSTLCRIWFKKNKKINTTALKKFLNENINSKFGNFILFDDFQNYKIPKNRQYGDCIFLANNGTVLFPNFYNYDEVKGMHGYNSLDPSMHGFAIILNNNNEKNDILYENKLTSIYKEIINILK